MVLIAILQEVRQRQGVVGNLRVFPEPCRNEFPVGIGAECKTECDPAGIEAGNIGVSRQPHEHPAAHI